MLKIFLAFISIQLIYSYPDGAPTEACHSMAPEHDGTVGTQKCQPKYLIQADRTDFTTNDAIRIIVRGATNTDQFKGIFLTAKTVDNQKIVGTWSMNDSLLQPVNCDNIPNTAVTHKSASEKSQIEAIWHAPASISEQNVIIKATIVESYSQFYVDCFSVTLNSNSKVVPVKSSETSQSKEITTKAKTKVDWVHSENVLTVTMSSESVGLNEWRSIGFSLDQEMGNEYVFICQVSASGNTMLRRMHTKAGKRPPSASNEDATVIENSFEDGVLTCKFSLDTNAEQAENEPAPIATDQNYYILFAAGQLRTEQQIAKHTLHIVTPTTYQVQNDETIDIDETVVPGTTTTMIGPTVNTTGSTSTNSTSTDPRIDIRWTYTNGVTNVNMAVQNLKTSRWIALGLSLDDQMGDDHVFACMYSSTSTVQLRRMINPGGHSRPVPNDNTAGFNVTRQAIENGVISCDFTLSNFVGSTRKKRQMKISDLSPSTGYYPLIAFGSLDQSNNLMRHASNGRRALSKQVFLNRQESIGDNFDPSQIDQTNLMKAHGALMVFTWIVLVSTGVLIARYFKTCWSDRKICGKAVWFAIHRTLMSSASILTLIAFVLILVYKKGQWTSKSSEREFAHSIVGILVISFAVIQPFMAIFRCNPNDEYRFIFNYAHATVGLSAFILSIVAIFLAMFFSQFEFQLKKEWIVLAVWSCWIPIIFIIFEIIEVKYRNDSKLDDEPTSYQLDQYNQNPSNKVESKVPLVNVRQQKVKIIFLLLHILVAIGLALAVIILIGQS